MNIIKLILLGFFIISGVIYLASCLITGMFGVYTEFTVPGIIALAVITFFLVGVAVANI